MSEIPGRSIMAKSILDSLVDGIVDSVCDADWLGRRGEKLTARELNLVRLFGRNGKVLRNVYIPKEDGETTEIDLLFITVKGICVLESKNYSGWIFGSESQHKWTASFPSGAKERFYNPIKQNRTHCKWLHRYLGDGTPLFSIVVFFERCELKKITVDSPDVKVVKRDRLYATIRDIRNESPDALSEAGVEAIHARLRPLTQVTKKQKKEHVESVKRRFR